MTLKTRFFSQQVELDHIQKWFPCLFFQANGIDIKMENGYVIVYFNKKMWKSTKQYNDGRWHYVTVTKRSGGYGGSNDFSFMIN